jgi:thymidine kinase
MFSFWYDSYHFTDSCDVDYLVHVVEHQLRGENNSGKCFVIDEATFLSNEIC